MHAATRTVHTVIDLVVGHIPPATLILHCLCASRPLAVHHMVSYNYSLPSLPEESDMSH